tara:strand:- start:1114 stop:1932 length:819 start_codon:yes stop_codon:yes gene_type:complete
MNKKTRYVLPLMGLIVTILMDSCTPPPSPWLRFDSSKTITIAALKVDQNLRQWDEVRSGRGKKEKVSWNLVPLPAEGDVDFGLNELGSFGKGLVKGKGKDTFKALAKERKDALNANEDNLSNFESSLLDNVMASLKEAKFNPTAGKTVYKWIDMKGEKVGRLVEKAGTDAVLTLSGRVGYVRTTKKAKMGFIKLDIGGATGEASYAFYGEFWLKVADKEGILGTHKMNITTGIVKKSDKGYPPVFNSEDYSTLNKVLRDAIGKFLTERKLMG